MGQEDFKAAFRAKVKSAKPVRFPSHLFDHRLSPPTAATAALTIMCFFLLYPPPIV
jgi:hypothetical protein